MYDNAVAFNQNNNSRPEVTKKARTMTLVLGILCVLLSVLPVWEQQTQLQLQQTMNQSVVTFALARGLNGVISVIQETEVAVQPAGVGVSFEPGQILDPVNDLVESFSDVMLASSLVLGSLRIFTELMSQDAIKIAVVLCGIIWLLSCRYWLHHSNWCRMITALLALLVSLRLFVPVAFLVSEHVSHWVLDDYYQTSTQALNKTQQEFQQTAHIQSNEQSKIEEQANNERSWSEQLTGTYQQAKRLFDIEEQLHQLKRQADIAIEHSIQLMVVFIIKVMVLPLLIGFLFIALIKRLTREIQHAI